MYLWLQATNWSFSPRQLQTKCVYFLLYFKVLIALRGAFSKKNVEILNQQLTNWLPEVGKKPSSPSTGMFRSRGLTLWPIHGEALIQCRFLQICTKLGLNSFHPNAIYNTIKLPGKNYCWLQKLRTEDTGIALSTRRLVPKTQLNGRPKHLSIESRPICTYRWEGKKSTSLNMRSLASAQT